MTMLKSFGILQLIASQAFFRKTPLIMLTFDISGLRAGVYIIKSV